MSVKVKILGPRGHEEYDLSPEEAQQLIYKRGQRYFIADWDTREILREIELEEGQTIALIPRIAGG